MSAQAPAFLANGNINPSVAVKMDSSASEGFLVIQAAAASDHVIGISQVGTYQPPGVIGSDGFAAHQYQPVQVFSIGDQCLWKVGASGITQGDYLISDANGCAVTAAFTGSGGKICCVAQALETANANEYARVLVLLQIVSGPTA